MGREVGTADTLREAAPDPGSDPRARPNLAPILLTPPGRPPCSWLESVAWSSFRNLLNAAIRSSGVAWRIRPIFKVCMIRDRRFR